LKECFHSNHGLTPTTDNILGILSLIFWARFLVISIKYLSFILRANNPGSRLHHGADRRKQSNKLLKFTLRNEHPFCILVFHSHDPEKFSAEILACFSVL
jgi:hypothetical protein